MTDDEARDKYLVPGLRRGLATLKLFTPETHSLSLSQIAAALGITRSAAFRTVYTLSSEGCLIFDDRAQAYSLGPGVMRLTYGYVATREVVEIAQPELVRLRDQTGWSVHLGALDGTSVIYLLRLAGARHDASIVHVGSRLPARATTIGRVLLSDLEPDQIVARYRSAQAPGASDKVGGGAANIAALLAQARNDARQEAILHRGDFDAGVVSIAAPVRNFSSSAICAVSVTRPNEEISAEELEAARLALLAACRRLSRLMGWDARVSRKADGAASAGDRDVPG